MKLWTIQPPEILKIIEETGSFICDKNKSFYGEDFKNPYKWMIKHMDLHCIPRPDDVSLPIWAWHTWNWKHKKPDFRMLGLGIRGKKYVCIELDIPDNEVLLSDFDSWHCVLNDSYNNPGKTENEWKELEERYESLNPVYQRMCKHLSWVDIFDVTPFDNGFCCIGKYIQAVFWEIKKENIISVKEFIAR